MPAMSTVLKRCLRLSGSNQRYFSKVVAPHAVPAGKNTANKWLGIGVGALMVGGGWYPGSSFSSSLETSTLDDDPTAKKVTEGVSQNGPLKLVRDGSPHDWQVFIEDPRRHSFSYILKNDASTPGQQPLAPETLDRWFQALHPDTLQSSHNKGGWSDAFYKGEKLLRKTAWYPFDGSNCAYGYSDTWQDAITDPQMRAVIDEITSEVDKLCGFHRRNRAGDSESPALNSVNLNYYPKGGGIGFHADDEYIFDGLNRDALIVSLSLCSAGQEGKRKFDVRLKKPTAPQNNPVEASCVLGHGDLMTMEGLFQLYYQHSVWPGDDKTKGDHELCQGERVNLTWRVIAKNSDGSPEYQAYKEGRSGR